MYGLYPCALVPLCSVGAGRTVDRYSGERGPCVPWECSRACGGRIARRGGMPYGAGPGRGSSARRVSNGRLDRSGRNGCAWSGLHVQRSRCTSGAGVAAGRLNGACGDHRASRGWAGAAGGLCRCTAGDRAGAERGAAQKQRAGWCRGLGEGRSRGTFRGRAREQCGAALGRSTRLRSGGVWRCVAHTRGCTGARYGAARGHSGELRRCAMLDCVGAHCGAAQGRHMGRHTTWCGRRHGAPRARGASAV